MRPTLICVLFLLLVLYCNEKQMADEQHLPMKSTTPDNTIMLSESQMQLANITTEKATKRNVRATNVINRTLTTDKQKSVGINSRAAGRIEKLFTKETGAAIRKG